MTCLHVFPLLFVLLQLGDGLLADAEQLLCLLQLHGLRAEEGRVNETKIFGRTVPEEVGQPLVQLWTVHDRQIMKIVALYQVKEATGSENTFF